jgi:Tfp pilus assembly protein PilO
MKKLTQLEKFGLIAAILVSVSYFYMKRIYDPEADALKKSIAALNRTVAEYNNVQEPPALRGVQAEVERLEKERADLTEQLRQAGGRTEAVSEVTEVLQLVNERLADEKLQLLKKSPEKELKEELFTWKVYSVELRGGYHQLVRFVGHLRQLRQPTQLRELKIERTPENDGVVKISAKLLV